MVYAAVSVSGSQKSEHFRVMDRVLIGPFDITAVSQYLWAKVGGRAMDWSVNGLVTGALFSLLHSFRARNAAFASLASSSACYAV